MNKLSHIKLLVKEKLKACKDTVHDTYSNIKKSYEDSLRLRSIRNAAILVSPLF